MFRIKLVCMQHPEAPSNGGNFVVTNSNNLCYLARSAKVAERAICFTDRNFFLFFNGFSETNYLKIRWTDFRNLYVE